MEGIVTMYNCLSTAIQAAFFQAIYEASRSMTDEQLCEYIARPGTTYAVKDALRQIIRERNSD